jgi:hypothetical protein
VPHLVTGEHPRIRERAHRPGQELRGIVDRHRNAKDQRRLDPPSAAAACR